MCRYAESLTISRTTTIQLTQFRWIYFWRIYGKHFHRSIKINWRQRYFVQKIVLQLFSVEEFSNLHGHRFFLQFDAKAVFLNCFTEAKEIKRSANGKSKMRPNQQINRFMRRFILVCGCRLCVLWLTQYTYFSGFKSETNWFYNCVRCKEHQPAAIIRRHRLIHRAPWLCPTLRP